jgi:2-oxoglutarate ferredoxin oxidoreductase subunit gamma
MSERTEILVSGFGGQGVVRIGQILGQAAVHQGLFTTMLISHGTETRGGYVRSQVVISDEFIDSPVVERPDFFCAFSAIAYDRFKGLCGPESVILHNPELVTPDPLLAARPLAIKAEDLAEHELGDAVFANVIFLGALSRALPQISPDNLIKALRERLPAKFHEKNLKAFELGRGC